MDQVFRYKPAYRPDKRTRVWVGVSALYVLGLLAVWVVGPSVLNFGVYLLITSRTLVSFGQFIVLGEFLRPRNESVIVRDGELVHFNWRGKPDAVIPLRARITLEELPRKLGVVTRSWEVRSGNEKFKFTDAMIDHQELISLLGKTG